jgi:uncharacterized membrane protein YgcG
MVLPWCAFANAAGIVLVDTDLEPLIEASARYPTRFAVEVPHRVTSDRAGTWELRDSKAVWQYAVRIPTAVSISFHASRVALPAGAVLLVRGADGTEYRYTASDVRKGSLWSRIAKGDSLQLELQVPAAERQSIRLEIDNFQAGYRGLDKSAASHPHYRRLKPHAAAVAESSCAQNFACSVNANNSGPGRATVGLVIGNAVQCTGTLIDDADHSNTPYILTARHCQSGSGGGGDPSAAERVTVYWSSITACGQPLNSLHSAAITSQTGAVTVFEQQDLWLIRLNENPAIDDAWFAGFDATGGAVVGGYSVHHAETLSKQFAGWFGQAAFVHLPASQLGVGYSSDFWHTVNQIGTISPGASGGALFDQNDRVVGALSLARNTAPGEECPANPPPAPTASNGLAFFTHFGLLWDNTSDATSSTGTRTLRSVLDPSNSGALVVDGAPAKAMVRLFVVASYGTVGNPIRISWNSHGATSCSATAGRPGDGWSGVLSGTFKDVAEAIEGEVTYGIECTYADGHVSKAQTKVNWNLPSPFAQLNPERFEVWTTRPATVSWISNESPCSITGGSVSLTNLSAAGSTTLTEAVPGTYSYSLKCGSGAREVQNARLIEFVAPSLTFLAIGTERRLGTGVELHWYTAADSCTPSGGAPGERWASNRYGHSQHVNFYHGVVSGLGTYTYTLTCTSGPITVQKDVTIDITSNAPYALLTASESTIAIGEEVVITWKSNGDYCNNPPTGAPNTNPFLISAMEGSQAVRPTQAGTLSFGYICSAVGTGMMIRTVDVNVVSPPVPILIIDKFSVRTGETFKLSWISQNTTTSCTASGGGADGSQWTGSVGTDGEKQITASVVGTFTYTIDCIGLLPRLTGRQQTTVTVSAAPPSGGGGGGSGGGGSSGGGGGGGTLGIYTLLAMLMSGAGGAAARLRRLRNGEELAEHREHREDGVSHIARLCDCSGFPSLSQPLSPQKDPRCRNR